MPIGGVFGLGVDCTDYIQSYELEGLHSRQVVFRYGWKSSCEFMSCNVTNVETCVWRGGGGFSAQFSGMIIFGMELYYGDQKSFVSYPLNNIEAYKYNILMILQSAIACTVIVIVGILVCIMVRLPLGLSPAP